MDFADNVGFIDDEHKIEIKDMGITPVVAAMIDVLMIPAILDKHFGSLDPRKKIDVGLASKALIIDILRGRSPLLRVMNGFQSLDCGVLLGEGLVPADINDDCLGDALEVLGKNDCRALYSEICLRALKLHGCSIETAHIDTTNFTVYGEYGEDNPKDFEITYGNPKNRRTDLKQFDIGLFVQENGLPFGGRSLSGNNSDAKWFREALSEMHKTVTGDLGTAPICVFDAAGSHNDMFADANELKYPTIIRMSDRLKMAGEHIARAWEEGDWQVIDKQGTIYEKEPEKNFYRLKTYPVSLGGFGWRLLVVYSSELEKVKEETAKRNFGKHKERLAKESAKIGRIGFDTSAEAEDAVKEFVNKNIGKKTPFLVESAIVEKATTKYNKAGRPGKTSEKTTSTKYHAMITVGERDEDLYCEWLRQESCFVLVSNVPVDRLAPEQLFAEYKEQWIIEDKFKFLKQPTVLEPVLLKKPVRVKGLVFILLLAVLVSMYICYRCMISLKDSVSGENKPLKKPRNNDDVGKTAQSEVVPEKESGNASDAIVPPDANRSAGMDMNDSKKEAFARWCSVGNKLLTSDGRLLAKPTFRVIKRELETLKTIVKIDSCGNEVRKFPYGTKLRLLDLVVKIGFDPAIYLEKFTPKMDFWARTFLSG